MKNDKFWNECSNGSLRQKIAEFIDNNPVASKLKGIVYHDFEDALVAFIYDNREMISKEVDLEYQREDFLTHSKEEFGDDVEEAVKVIPIDVIDGMINQWQEALGDNDAYWDITWSELSDVLTDSGISPFIGIDEYPTEAVLIYAAYLNEWYSDMPPEMQDQEPVCIDEFFSIEMKDEEAKDFYIKAAKKLFGDKFSNYCPTTKK